MQTQLAFQLTDGSANLTPSLNIYSPISYAEAYKLVSAYHYLGRKRFIGQYCFGIIKDYQIIGAIIYSPLSVPNSAQSAFGFPRGSYPDLLEMSRLVLEPALNGKNVGSSFIAYSLKELKKKKIRAVISYADSDRHVGAVYQAANFGYYGLSPQKNDFIFSNGKKLTRGKSKGFVGEWIPRSRKHRYVYLIDKSLKIIWPKEKYPK
jgi:predicted N-acetyltransferase YhbS